MITYPQNKSCLLIQPGAYGDLFICAPIAEFYSNLGYAIYWPVTNKFKEIIDGFDYVIPLNISENILHDDWLRSNVINIFSTYKMEDFDIILNLADRGPHQTAQLNSENFEQCKYRLSNVPFERKNRLKFTRNIEKELELKKKVGINGPYVLAHLEDSFKNRTTCPEEEFPIIEVRPIEGYSIMDWYLLATEARKIYCIESSLHQFFDGVVSELPNERYLLPRSMQDKGYRFTVSLNWNKKYIGDIGVKG